MNYDKEIKDTLIEILKWTKFQGKQQVKQILESVLDTDSKRLVYELSDGRSSPAIATIVNVHHSTVLDYWKLWAPVGIMEIHPDYQKRYRKIFSLKEVGIIIPSHEEPTGEQEESTEEE